MSDDPEIIPPARGGVPATRQEAASVPASRSSPIAEPTGVVSSLLTGFQARMQGRAYLDIANNIRAQTEALDAETARRESALKLRRTIHKLEELDDILAEDRAERADARETTYDKIERQRAERAHQRKLDELRRQRELEEASGQLIEAKRGTFNATQGLENQQRIKQLNLEMWEKSAATEHMNAEKVWLLLRREVERMAAPQQKPVEGSLEHLAEMRASLEQRAQEAAAQGDASKAERYEHLAAELDALVLAAMRGRS
jgi:hypothetical protein